MEGKGGPGGRARRAGNGREFGTAEKPPTVSSSRAGASLPPKTGAAMRNAPAPGARGASKAGAGFFLRFQRTTAPYSTAISARRLGSTPLRASTTARP